MSARHAAALLIGLGLASGAALAEDTGGPVASPAPLAGPATASTAALTPSSEAPAEIVLPALPDVSVTVDAAAVTEATVDGENRSAEPTVAQAPEAQPSAAEVARPATPVAQPSAEVTSPATPAAQPSAETVANPAAPTDQPAAEAVATPAAPATETPAVSVAAPASPGNVEMPPSSGEVAIAPPDLPPVAVTVPVEAPAKAADIPPPSFPAAPVVITTAERMPGAVQVLLADEKAAPLAKLSRADRESVAAFYALGAYQPLWIKGEAWSPAGHAVIERLKLAGEDALDPTDYPIPAIGVVRAGDTITELAAADLTLTASAVLYARDARGARIDPGQLSRLLTPTRDLPSAEEVLTRLAGSPDPGAALASFNPSHAGYQALKRKLVELRAKKPSGTPTVAVPPGRTLRLGMRDSRVPLIRARFGIGPAEGDAATAYDERVASAVASFQRENGLQPNGVLTPRTVAALAGPPPARAEGDIVANMERWRWLPENLGPRYIFVNVPEFRLHLMDGGRQVHEARVITGKPESPTPIFSDEMEYAVVNPSWTVPPSIMKKEFLPRLAEDPTYAQRLGYEVIRRGNQIYVRQPPGERNALGFIKFMFPNDHAVYLHDTPNRRLFQAGRRAFSHGCVRVDQPFRLADFVFGDAWPEDRLRKLIGKGERTIRLAAPLPIHIAYFTMMVNARGEIESYEDLYGYHRRVRAALGYGG